MSSIPEKATEHYGETQVIKDHDHDMIHELSKRLDGVWRYDQYIANAGHLYCLMTGRYRFVADLRSALLPHIDRATFTAKPYDLSTALIASEAGAVITSPTGGPLRAPFDTDAPVGFIGYGSTSLHRSLEPLLIAASAPYIRFPRT